MSSNIKIDTQLLEQIVECSFICIFDKNFNIAYTNENFCNLTGFQENECHGKNLRQLKHPDQGDAVDDFIIKTLLRGETWKGELQINHKNQHPVWLDTTIKPAHSDTIKDCYIATFINISPRKQLIDHLKQRAHRQGLIAILGQISLNNIPINDLLEQTLSVVCGSLKIKTGFILEININKKNTLARSTYNTSQIVTGKSIINIEDNNILDFTLQTEQPVVCKSLKNETRFNVPDIFIKEGYSSAVCILIGDKKHQFGILTLLTDTQESINIDETHFLQSVCNILAEAINRQNMEKTLRHERELLRKYLDVAEVIFIVLDKQEKILLANRYAASVFGYPQEDLTGMNFIDTFTPDNIKSIVQKNYHKMLANQTVADDLLNIHGNVTSIINRQNEIRYIKWKSSRLYAEDGSVTAILSAGEDITELLETEKEQKQLEKQLHQAQKLEAIGMLAGGIAHDFNNILASILGFSELAFENLKSDDTKLHEYLTQIQNSGIKARDIIAQMQSINLLDDTPNKAILLPSLLKGTLQMLRSALPSSIDMHLNIDNDIPAVNLNASNFNQVIMHLLTNSRNALKGKGHIKIELSIKKVSGIHCSSCNKTIDDKYVVLSIHDDGPGINYNILPSLFKKSSPSSNSGLPFVSRLIHDSHGHLLISENEQINNTESPGTSIQLLFEIFQTKHIESKPGHNIIDLSDVKNKNIMIVDDENSVASYMGELFKGAGFRVKVFCDSIKALESFKNTPDNYDLIITDQTMPALTGDILASKILKVRPELPIIICTGQSDLLDREKAEDLQIQGFLKKPVDSAQLLHTVVSLLTKNQGEKQS